MVAIPGGAQRLGDMPTGGEPLPEGVYYVRADRAELKQITGANAKNKGGSLVAVMFSVFGPAEQEALVGRKIFENFVTQGEGRWRQAAFFKASGEGDDFVYEDSDQFLRREVAVAVMTEKGTANPAGGMYPDKSVIKKFMSIAEAEEQKAAAAAAPATS